MSFPSPYNEQNCDQILTTLPVKYYSNTNHRTNRYQSIPIDINRYQSDTNQIPIRYQSDTNQIPIRHKSHKFLSTIHKTHNSTITRKNIIQCARISSLSRVRMVSRIENQYRSVRRLLCRSIVVRLSFDCRSTHRFSLVDGTVIPAQHAVKPARLKPARLVDSIDSVSVYHTRRSSRTSQNR